jgi:hypothetical protein
MCAHRFVWVLNSTQTDGLAGFDGITKQSREEASINEFIIKADYLRRGLGTRCVVFFLNC